MAKPFSGEIELNCTIGRQIRLARRIKNMSMEKLGREIGITYQQMQKFEKGENRISAARLFKISQILKQPIPFFHDGVIDDFESQISYVELKTAYTIQQMDEKTKQTLIELVESMAKTSSKTPE